MRRLFSRLQPHFCRRPVHLGRPAIFALPAPIFSLGLAAAAACGSDGNSSSAAADASPSPGTTQVAPAATTIISLPVMLNPLPWDPSGSSFDTQYMSVQVGDPAPVFNDTTGTAQVTWTNTTLVPASSCTTDGDKVRTCSVTIPNIEIKDYSIGMLVKVSDTRTSYTGVAWNSLSTGVAQATLTALRGAAAGGQASPVFAMTSDGSDQLAKWTGILKPDLINNGTMIGLILDKTQAPVKGAQLTVSDPDLQLIYANSDFSAAGTPGPNATLPYFVVTPSKAKVVKSTGWTISAPAPATATWSVPLVGSAPGYMVMIPFVGQ